MSTLFPKTIDYISGSGGSYVNGVFVPGAPVASTFQGSVQPMSGKEIQSFSWARKDTGHVKIYSGTPLPISTEGGDTKGAVVEWQSQLWEVVHELKNQNDLIPHYKYIAEYRDGV